MLTSLLAVRSLWSSGWPAVGYSLPLSDSGSAAVGAYAGGWNPGGFGSVEPLEPLIGFTGLIQTILADSPTVTAWLLSLAAVVAGIWGTIRLLRGWNIEVVGGWAAGIVLVAGPAAQAIGDRTAIGQLLAIGVLPWALRVLDTRWSHGWLRRLGRVVAATWVIGLLGVLAPPLLVAPILVLVVRLVLRPVDRAVWKSLAIALPATLLALPLLLPWLSIVDIERYLSSGSEYWTPALIPTKKVPTTRLPS